MTTRLLKMSFPLLLALAAMPLAAQTGTVFACIDNTTAQIRIPVVAAGSTDQGTPVCRQNETLLQWSTAGPQGPAGLAGATGLPGGHGPQGAPGAVGAMGSAGVAGAAGATGSAGSAGTAGSPGAAGAVGATGLAGAAGAAGAQGSQGATGAAGAAGVAGASGVAGVAGAVGARGSDGAPGVAGNQGALGSTGVAGENGPVGSTGATGATGSAGAAGAAGTSASGFSVRGVIACGTTLRAGSMAFIPGRAFSAFAGADGAFQLNNVPPGTYALSLRVSSNNSVRVSLSGGSVTVSSSDVNMGTITACPCGTPCSGSTPICIVTQTTSRCVQCNANSHCTNPAFPVCAGFRCTSIL